ncbi:MAG: hypothetical protein QGI21_04980 [Candidatus Poseidoniaceae archaeon]|jgi:hypothetical protein|nr:hypothetical protein [Candidatus Poseidoniaceae archaeon]
MTDDVALWVLTIPVLIACGWMVWRRWWSTNNLEGRLRDCDFNLLSSDQFGITEVIQAPQGSVVNNIAQVVIQNTTVQRMIPMYLPDGRMVMVPDNTKQAGNQDVRAVPIHRPPVQ